MDTLYGDELVATPMEQAAADNPDVGQAVPQRTMYRIYSGQANALTVLDNFLPPDFWVVHISALAPGPALVYQNGGDGFTVYLCGPVSAEGCGASRRFVVPGRDITKLRIDPLGGTVFYIAAACAGYDPTAVL